MGGWEVKGGGPCLLYRIEAGAAGMGYKSGGSEEWSADVMLYSALR